MYAPDPTAQLAALRAEIDAIDQQLASLLIDRARVVDSVGALKKQHWPASCHIRPGREGQMHRALFARFAGSGISPQAGLAIWRHIISSSTHRESPLSILSLHGLRAEAEQYFGTYVAQAEAASVQALLHALMQGSSNIVILPFPTEATSGIWREWLAQPASAAFNIFAYMPVVGNGTPRAVALARVPCEPSGDDWSYLADAEGNITYTPHFLTDNTVPQGSRLLGAHAAPLTL